MTLDRALFLGGEGKVTFKLRVKQMAGKAHQRHGVPIGSAPGHAAHLTASGLVPLPVPWAAAQGEWRAEE